MLSNTLKRLNRTNRLITMDDISDSLLAGRSAAHTSCWKYLQMASYDAALEHSEQIIKREPEKPDGYVFKARALYQLGRYEDAEEVLLRVMQIAEESGLGRTDVEGMVKLKDELANSRVEILRSRNFREPIDIAEMHWNDCSQPILELIGLKSRKQSRNVQKSAPMDVDISIVDIIGAEKAKQLYPELRIESSNYNSNGYNRRRETGFPNMNLSAEFPTREDRARRTPHREERERTPQRQNRKEELSDLELRTAGLKTSLLLAEEKNQKYEQKIKGLEEELKKVYEKVIKITKEKQQMEKKCETLVSQLDKVVEKRSTVANRNDSDSEIQILREMSLNKKRRNFTPITSTPMFSEQPMNRYPVREVPQQYTILRRGNALYDGMNNY